MNTTTLREEHKRLTRERLVDAAVEIIGDVGFRAATVEEISRRANCNRSTFYLHFKTKEDLYGAMTARMEPVGGRIYEHLGALQNPSIADICKWLEEMEEAGREMSLLIKARTRALAYTPALAEQWIQSIKNVVQHDFGYLEHFTGERLTAATTKLVLVHMMLERYIYVTCVSNVGLDDPNAREILAKILLDLLWNQDEFTDNDPIVPEP